MPNAIASKDGEDGGILSFFVNIICTAQAKRIVDKAQTSLTYSVKRNSVTKHNIMDATDRQRGAILLDMGMGV